MFGLGMNNNGTGLVLASAAMASQPLVMLPIILYNLVQHLIAGLVDMLLRRVVRIEVFRSMQNDGARPAASRLTPQSPGHGRVPASFIRTA